MHSPNRDGAAEGFALLRPGNSADHGIGRLKKWICVICGWIYDEAAELPEEGIPPGTRLPDIPDDWRCPLCGVGENDFVLVEI
jgi:rubredoxin